MQPTFSELISALVLFAPLSVCLVGIMPVSMANSHPRLMARMNSGAAWLALACALIASAAYMFGSIDTAYGWTLFSVDLPGDIGAFSIGTYLNSVTLIMLVLVSFVGVIVSRYSRNYLDGDPNQGRFHKWLSLTLGTILTLIISGNMLMFSLAWIINSLCLNQLLMFYRERPAAVLAAHKKFVANRIGDLAQITAIFLIGSTLHSLEFSDLYHSMQGMAGPLPPALQWASMLIVVSAVLKSAQFPLHGWLIQVVEAPTPVSALLHAGIVNAGAFLVIRMSPIMSLSPTAMGVLAIIGLITLGLASMVMLTQTSIKVSLAWSTTAQMGFMLLECGLGLYSLAMLHLVAHSLYKAHAFLASGSGVDAFRAPTMAPGSKGFQPGRLLLALTISGSMVLGVGALFGVTLDRQPALLAAGAIVAIAVSQLMMQAASLMSGTLFLSRALGVSAIVSTAYFTLHAVFDRLLLGSVQPMRETAGMFESTLAMVIVGVFLALLLLQETFKYARSSLGDVVYMHLYNGLYIDVFITRLLQRIWPVPQSSYIATTRKYGA